MRIWLFLLAGSGCSILGVAQAPTEGTVKGIIQSPVPARSPLTFYFTYTGTEHGYSYTPNLADSYYIYNIKIDNPSVLGRLGVELGTGLRKQINDQFSIVAGFRTEVFTKSLFFSYIDYSYASQIYADSAKSNQILLHSFGGREQFEDQLNIFWLLAARLGADYRVGKGKIKEYVSAGYSWNTVVFNWRAGAEHRFFCRRGACLSPI